jgi:hypothetical protein
VGVVDQQHGGDFDRRFLFAEIARVEHGRESAAASYLDTLGRCYYAAGDLENAVKHQPTVGRWGILRRCSGSSRCSKKRWRKNKRAERGNDEVGEDLDDRDGLRR